MGVFRLMKDIDDSPLKDQFQVAAFYLFIHVSEDLILSLLDQFDHSATENNLRGTVLLASEGVNGTICGSKEGVSSFIEILKSSFSVKSLQIKYHLTNQQAFRRFKVRRKAEIVTMGIHGVNPSETVGTYVEPSEWNDCLNDPDTLVIDTRNKYEIGIGSFKNSLNPHIDNFREFPNWVQKHLRPLVKKNPPKRIAMFCTGGIRCEKATSYLKQEGFKAVHHLHGGILHYLEDVPQEESLWRGECFVFDQRVALTHKLLPGEYRLCYACGMPLNSVERKSLNYVRGVQCHHCKSRFSDSDRARFAERQRHFDKCLRQFPETYSWLRP